MENFLPLYIGLSVIFASVLAYMYLYTTHLKPRERCQELKGRPPISKEEGIAVATLEKERNHKIGRF
jgi:hypothetical protein